MKYQKWLSIFLAAVVVLSLASCKKEPQAENSGVDGKLAATFYSNDGSILKTDYVQKGGTAVPPEEPQMSYGMIFQSWDTDFSMVTKDIEVRPVCENVTEKTNAFAVASAYGKVGDTVTVPVTLCGQVCVAGFDITITYDPELLELISVSEDGAVLYNDEVPGKIRLNYVSVENTEADVDICRLQFRIKSGSGSIPVTMELHSIYACSNDMDTEDDSMYVPEAYLVGGNIRVIP
jgi:hypothetical protein